MKPQAQLTDDDCFRTCVAMILDMDAEDVPHFYEDYDSMTAWDVRKAAEEYINNWLMSKGVIRIRTGISVRTVEEVPGIVVGSLSPPGTPFIISGASQNGTPHCVACLDSKIYNPNGWCKIVGPLEGYGVYLVEWIVRPL